MDDRFKHQGTVEDRLIEECSELIKAVCKAKRFGWQSRWPNVREDVETNMDAVMREMDDCRMVMREMQREILDIARKELERKELIAGHIIMPSDLGKSLQRVNSNLYDIHYMSGKIRGIIGARTKCGLIVASETPAWVNDDWNRVTCPECLKARPRPTDLTGCNYCANPNCTMRKQDSEIRPDDCPEDCKRCGEDKTNCNNCMKGVLG